MRIRTFLIISLSFLVICFPIHAQSEESRRLYPLPLAELEQVVHRWLFDSDFQVSRSKLEDGKVLLTATSKRGTCQMTLIPHSALATEIKGTCAFKDRDSGAIEGELWRYLTIYVTDSSARGKDDNQHAPVGVLSKRESVVCINANVENEEVQFSGFFIHPEGLIISTAHDLKGVNDITVTLHDGREFKGHLLKTDPYRDLALIDINVKVNTAVSLSGGRNLLRDGEQVPGNGFGGFFDTVGDNPGVSGRVEREMNYGRYRIVRELGKGSIGVVYQAHDPHIDRLVALKVLRPDLVTTEQFVQRFLKEAKAIGRLSHPNIVTVYDVGRDHGTIYIAMEFVEGDRLDNIMEKREFTEKETVEFGIHVARILHYAHQNGIVHRDIKPSNIMLKSNGHLKITDFGIAHIEDPSAIQQTRAGEIIGTPAYMSPEQVLGQPVDGRSDLYSLGSILYELTTGNMPFRGENLTAVFRAITVEVPPDPAKLTSPISPSLSRIIMKCLNKRPEKRFPTGEAMAEALEDFLREKKSMPVAAPSARKISRNLLLVPVVIILVAVITGGLIYRLITGREAFLKLESSPIGAQIFVDGRFKGKTPLHLELPVGKHEIRLTLLDYYDWEAQVELTEEGETPLFVRLLPIEGKSQ